MFSLAQKQKIAEAVQGILRATQHPELPPKDEIEFELHVKGAESWSWADIRNNGFYGLSNIPVSNEWNEQQDKGKRSKDESRN